MSEKVRCFHCEKAVALRADGTYAKHGWTTYGVRKDCERSGQPHNRHSASFRVVTREPVRWLSECLCGESFIADTYKEVDTMWLAHVEIAKAKAS